MEIARLPNSMNLFVYGTLLVPRIWTAVTGCSNPDSIPGQLSGHRIQKVIGGDFPAIVLDPEATASVPGLVIQNVSPAAMLQLDQYEDNFYERIEVAVETNSGSVNAQVYRMPLDYADRLLSNEDWTLAWFENEALERYWNRLFA